MKTLIGIIIVMIVILWLAFFVGAKYIFENKDEIAKELGKVTESVSNSFEEGRDSIKSDTLVIDSLETLKK